MTARTPWSVRLIAFSIIASLAFVGSAAAIGAAGGQKEIEVYGGIFTSDIEFLDEEATFGVRFGGNLTDRFNLQVQLGALPLDADFNSDIWSGDADLDSWVFEVSAGLNLRPGKRWNPLLFGGIGYVSAEGDGVLTRKGDGLTIDFSHLEEDSFTVHAGLNSKIYVTDNFYVRPGTRVRWYEAREDFEELGEKFDVDEFDIEYTLGLGWVW
jgi:opacity protein-like surface antigen